VVRAVIGQSKQTGGASSMFKVGWSVWCIVSQHAKPNGMADIQ